MARRNLSLQEEEKIISLFTAGRNSSQIAKELNLAYQTVHRRIQKLKNVNSEEGAVERPQKAQASSIKSPAARGRRRNSGVYTATGVDSASLKCISTRKVYQGEFLTFIHDVSSDAVSIEVNGHELMRFEIEAFMMLVRDIERMKALFANIASPSDAR